MKLSAWICQETLSNSRGTPDVPLSCDEVADEYRRAVTQAVPDVSPTSLGELMVLNRP